MQKRFPEIIRRGVFAGLFLVTALASSLFAADNFREKFIEYQRINQFYAITKLVQDNAAVIPGEVRALIKEAMAEDKPYGERMELLDLANSIATMHMHWNEQKESSALVTEIEALQRAEIEKEQARTAEIMKWDKFEKTLGNFVMRGEIPLIEKNGLAPVIYPHWLHRLYYDCKTCHQGVFKMKRGANKITHMAMDNGFSCGKCHNGTTAFTTKEKCEMCHAAGLESGKRLGDVSKLDVERVKKTAERLGAGLDTAALPNGKMPLDRFGSVDWVYLDSAKAAKRLKSIDGKDAKDETRDNTILFKPAMPYIADVLFDHKAHSSKAACATCHPSIFKEELGGDVMTMKDMGEGKFCGYCHGKVSFRFADCKKCHTQPTEKEAREALKRTK